MNVLGDSISDRPATNGLGGLAPPPRRHRRSDYRTCVIRTAPDGNPRLVGYRADLWAPPPISHMRTCFGGSDPCPISTERSIESLGGGRGRCLGG